MNGVLSNGPPPCAGGAEPPAFLGNQRDSTTTHVARIEERGEATTTTLLHAAPEGNTLDRLAWQLAARQPR